MKTKQQHVGTQKGGVGQWVRLTAGVVLLPMMVACGTAGVGSTAGNSSSSTTGETETASTDLSSNFPSGLAVASPLSTESDDSESSASLSKSIRKGSGSVSSRYLAFVDKINALLTGGTSGHCTFDPALFLTQERNADCYGPTVQYQAHPDTVSTDARYNGQLPSGDVGMWTSVNPTDGHACAAAELNARMDGVAERSLAALMGLASMICTADASGIAAPHNSTVDLTVEMNALGVTDTTFASATATHSDATGTDVWSYDLDLTYSPMGVAHHVVVAMKHIPGATSAEYQGRLTFRVGDTTTAGNCPVGDVTDNESLLYASNSATDMNLELRSGQFCGTDSDGTVDGIVDASLKYDAASLPAGWGNNFNVLTTDFDPSTLAGNFAFSWQAGPRDANTRVFNVRMDASTSSVLPDGKAFFGYGADVDGTDGGIDGFICNWAGPNNSHTTQDFAQYQSVQFDSASKVYAVVDEHLTYAVTNACTYDGTGSFTVDSDMDGVVDTDPATPIANGLQSLVDADANGLFDEVEAVGFTLPTAPANI